MYITFAAEILGSNHESYVHYSVFNLNLNSFICAALSAGYFK